MPFRLRIAPGDDTRPPVTEMNLLRIRLHAAGRAVEMIRRTRTPPPAVLIKEAGILRRFVTHSGPRQTQRPHRCYDPDRRLPPTRSVLPALRHLPAARAGSPGCVPSLCPCPGSPSPPAQLAAQR